MGEYKQEAVLVANRLHQEDRIDYGDYTALMDGLEELPLLSEWDAALEELWAKLGDVPMDPETERMDAPFLGFPAGTPREDIWHWFDERHSKGVAHLLYGRRNQPDERMKCYTVVDSSYDVGLSTYAFWDEEHAKKSIQDDVQTVKADLAMQGYERIEVLEKTDSTVVYVPDTDIYYEWTICETEIR